MSEGLQVQVVRAGLGMMAVLLLLEQVALLSADAVAAAPAEIAGPANHMAPFIEYQYEYVFAVWGVAGVNMMILFTVTMHANIYFKKRGEPGLFSFYVR